MALSREAFLVLLLKECEECGGTEERIFTDSWTGKELCCACLSNVLQQVTMSPASEGDNLEALLKITRNIDDDE